MAAVDHIVFDIGGVLIHWDPDIPYRALIPDRAARATFLRDVCSPEWNREQDRGRSWPDAEAVLIAEHPDKAELIRAFRGRWCEMIPFAHDDTVSLMTRLVALGRDVTLLTNFAADTLEEATARYPFLRCTRGATVSGLVGAIKPDDEIYRHHQSEFGLDPNATVFIDDKPENVEAARRLGWRGIHYSGPDALESELKALKVL